jgi:hypothetical protein
MASISSVSASATAGVVRNADQNIAVAASLLQKIDAADKNLVATLLPPVSPVAPGRLDLKA